MAQSGIKIKLEGFDDILAKIQKAGGTVDNAAKACIEKSADKIDGDKQFMVSPFPIIYLLYQSKMVFSILSCGF